MKIALQGSNKHFQFHEPDNKKELRCFSCERKIGDVIIYDSLETKQVVIQCLCGEETEIKIEGEAKMTFLYNVDIDYERTNDIKEDIKTGILTIKVNK